MKEMRNVPNDQKAEFGKTINGAKEWANQFFDELDQKLKEKEQQDVMNLKRLIFPCLQRRFVTEIFIR